MVSRFVETISKKIDDIQYYIDARLKKSSPYRKFVYTTTAIIASLLMLAGMWAGMQQVTWLGIMDFFILFVLNFYLHAFYFYPIATSEGKPEQKQISAILKWSYIVGCPLTLLYGIGVVVLLVGRVWAARYSR